MSELHGDGLKGIVDILRGVRYLRQIVVSISGSEDRADYEEMRRFWDGVCTIDGEPPILLWNSGRRVEGLFQQLRHEGLDPGANGKGRATWIAYGYVLASNVSRVIAVHDCDILSYDRSLLARLVYPVMNRNLGLEFVKGYYARVTDRMYGRVTRLFITPVVRAMSELLGDRCFLNYLDDFRYPLSGEIALTSESRFIRCFRDATGQTPARYVQDRRLRRAAEALVATDRSIDEIAERCGFANRYYFTRVFSQRMGVSPARYRSNWPHYDQGTPPEMPSSTKHAAPTK